jgi:dTDP-4-dehydrorhamnose reductase
MPFSSPVLVIGIGGQLSSALARQAADVPLLQVERPEIDLLQPQTVAPALERIRPALVINAAAYTAVDRAESERERAWAINASGPAAIAAWCAAAGVPLLHVSTDYVFDGRKGAPYVETDPPSPTGVYGESKLAGEQAVLQRCPQAAVVRTAWVVSAVGHNFVLTMLNAARQGRQLRVVADQVGCPTPAADLAAVLLAIARRSLAEGWQPGWSGIFHAAGTGATSWYGLAVATFEEAARHGLQNPEIVPITTADWPTPVRRPADSRLDCGKLAATFGLRLPPWRLGLSKIVDTVLTDCGSPG